MPKILEAIQIVKNMGWRYTSYRIGHEIRKRTGWFLKTFPIQPPFKNYITLQEWKKGKPAFFFDNISGNNFDTLPIAQLAKPAALHGDIRFFNADLIHLGENYDWLTNPETGYQYDVNQHWSQVNDFSPVNGDIKAVWEKSRFSYLYEIIRYDEQHKTDHSAFVFNEIISWINANPVNAGPNYKCSQEISLRCLNWTFALYYYQQSAALTISVFDKMQYAMYWQMKHVYDHIDFSRIAVRNNHAITETLGLYIVGALFPSFPDAASWKREGKKWFEQEIAYQVYEDGTFLQFSMNYHRVVVQLFSWALAVSAALGENFGAVVYERAYNSLRFLYTCQDKETGWLPNYGSNDGALFFPLSTCHYRDFRPQLNALHQLLTGHPLYPAGAWQEEAWWLRAAVLCRNEYPALKLQEGWHLFNDGGYAVLREKETLSFIRCGKHKDRPAQADNLHLDIWYRGQNVLQDAGSYKYNTTKEIGQYFMGTRSHNTVMLGTYDQMLKGERFIWYHWSQAIGMEVSETAATYIFEGSVNAFMQIEKNIVHRRKVTKWKHEARWEVEDTIYNKPDELAIHQIWHPGIEEITLTAKDDTAKEVLKEKEQGWVSVFYGRKEESPMFNFATKRASLKTTIQI